MGRVQTRRSVSISAAAYRELQAFATALGLSGSAVVEAALSAFMAGTPCAENEKPATEPVLRVTAATAEPPPRDRIRLPAQLTEPTMVRRRTGLKPDKPTEVTRIGLCAVCANTRSVEKTQLDPGGPVYLVCTSCNDDAPTERDHLFGPVNRGVGGGNHHARRGGLR